MARGAANSNVRTQFNILNQVGVVGDLTDGLLLQRFLTAGGGAAEAAFVALVQRHGPMVRGVCREVLGDLHDSQDAFQATFLILARKSASVRKADSLASWLHGVALRVAVRTKLDATRRRACERAGAAIRAAERQASGDSAGTWPELHEEVARLPERYREPIVLCYLEGMSTEAAAGRIGCPRGTVLSRLSRAKERLRTRLIRRGVEPPAALLAAGLRHDTASVAIPAVLLESTIRASFAYVGRQVTAPAAVSAAAAALAKRVLLAMTISKFKAIVAAILGCTLGLAGASASAYLFQKGNEAGKASVTETGSLKTPSVPSGLVRVDEVEQRKEQAEALRAAHQAISTEERNDPYLRNYPKTLEAAPIR